MHACGELPPRDLAALGLSGDREAFASLVRRHAPLVRAVCAARLGAREADDAAQEVFLRAWTNRPRLRSPARFAPYVLGIARHLCIDRLRSRARATLSLEELELEPVDPREPDHERRRLLARLDRELERLPVLLLDALRLFHFEELSYARVADRLGTTETAVNSRISRARRRLRAAFLDETWSGGAP